MMVRKLYDAFAQQMDGSLSTPGIDGERQGTHFAGGKHFIGVLDRHISGNTQSVVFTMETVNNSYLLRFFLPLYGREYKRLLGSRYTPALRSKHYLTVGLGEQAGIRYAYCVLKLPPYCGVGGLLDGMTRMGRELEKYLAPANMGVL